MKLKYYFFKSATTMSNGVTQLGMHPLPNQTTLQGDPIDPTAWVFGIFINRDTNYNYPEGTIFCSDYIESYSSSCGPEYSIRHDDPVNGPFTLYPVKSEPGFKYQKPDHENERVNIAYILFDGGIDPVFPDDDTTTVPMKSTKKRYSPFDKKGNAIGRIEGWQESYFGQIDTESDLFIDWMHMIFKEENVKLPMRLSSATVKGLYTEAAFRGENIDTLASRRRFKRILEVEKLSVSDFALLKDGPAKRYLSYIIQEHDKAKECTAVERDPNIKCEIEDAATFVCKVFNSLSGSMVLPFDKNDIDNLKKGLENGWKVNELLDPELIVMQNSYSDYVKALADGKINPPETEPVTAGSFIANLMSEKRFKKPTDKDGFHIEERTWKILVRNLMRKECTLLVGPTGSGKTQIVQKLCEKTGTPLTVIQMGSITDPTEQLVGKMDIDIQTGGTRFDWAEFSQAIQRPGVILLDEINRIPDNGDNILFSCLDGTRELSAAGAKSTDIRTIKVHPDCVFFATANIGARYTGTKEMDSALMNRFLPVEIGYMSLPTERKILMTRTGISEDDANNITFIASKIRKMAARDELQTTVSTRETLRCASLVADGFDCLEAVELAFLPLFDNGADDSDTSSERNTIRTIIATRFNNQQD